MKQYLRAHDGRECLIDMNNPLVMIKGRDFGENYQRGSLAYPIGYEGQKPGHHSREGWMTISTLNTDTANFCGVEVGKTAVPLRDLLGISGNQLGISYNGKEFTRNGKRIGGETAINEMLDNYATMQLPAEVRDASGLSRAISSEPIQYERGIIFDSLEELAHGLKVYDGGSITASRATEDRFYQDTWDSDNPRAGVDDPSIFRQTPKASFVQQALALINQGKGSLVDQMIAGIHSSGGRYRKSFDYDGMGTSFFKTSVEVDEIDGKYVLGIWAAYVGDKPEIELAQKLGKERGLVRVGSSHHLTPIAQSWIGLDVCRAMGEGTLTPEQISALTRISAGESKSYGGFVVEMDGMLINLSLGIEQEKNYRADVLRARGNQLFMRTEGEGKPYFSLSLRPAGKDKIVSSEGKGKITKIRDGLSKLVQENLS